MSREDAAPDRVGEVSVRLYSSLIRLYPPTFRREYGKAMVRAFAEALEARRQRHGPWGLVLHWGRTLRDLGVNVPAEWVGSWETLRYELEHAARGLLRAPGLSLTIAGTLAVGIGVITAFFSLANALLFRPLPYAEPEALVRVQEGGRGMALYHVSAEALDALRSGAATIEGPAMYRPTSLNLGTDSWTESVRGARVGPDLLPLLGVRPALGRLPGPGDAFAGTETVVLVGHDLWLRRFQADPAAVGRSVTVEGQPTRIVGVMPEGFGFPEFGEIWAPFTEPRPALLAPGEQVAVVARLVDGVSLERARQEIEAMGAALAQGGMIPPQNALRVGEGLYVRSRGFGFLPWVFLGAGTAVLLVVCSNIASLLLARGARRRTEMAVRSSLGASRSRLMGRTLVEGGILAVAGGALGLVLSVVILGVFLTHLGANFPIWFDPALDSRVALFALGASTASVLVFGLPAALEGSRVDLAQVLAAGGSGTSGGRGAHRLRSGLIAAEVAFAFLLVTGGSLMAASVSRMRGMDLGVDTEASYDAGMSLTGTPDERPESRRAFVHAVLERLSGSPGIVHAAAEGTFRGFSHDGAEALDSLASRPIRAEGGVELSWSELRLRAVTEDYFAAAGLDVLQGRTFGPTDVEGGPLVAVVSAAVADRLWPTGDAVGRALELGSPGGVTVQIVGLVEDHRTLGGGVPGGDGFRLDPLPFLYLPEAQTTLVNPSLVVRPAPAARDRIGAVVRDVVHEVDPRQAVGSVRTLGASEDVLRNGFRTIAVMMVGLALAAAGLAMLGIWSVITQAVARRTREIGIRTAIGGSATRTVAGIMAGGLRVTLLGLLVGLGLALLLTRVLGSVLYQVDPLDPAVLAGTAALFMGVGLLATYLPARRAARVDPVRALRSE